MPCFSNIQKDSAEYSISATDIFINLGYGDNGYNFGGGYRWKYVGIGINYSSLFNSYPEDETGRPPGTKWEYSRFNGPKICFDIYGFLPVNNNLEFILLYGIGFEKKFRYKSYYVDDYPFYYKAGGIYDSEFVFEDTSINIGAGIHFDFKKQLSIGFLYHSKCGFNILFGFTF